MSAKRRSCLRHPRTTQEMRANGRRGVLNLDEYRIYIRPSRTSKRLPNSYDDLWIRDASWEDYVFDGVIFHYVCWKTKRKTQYFNTTHYVNPENMEVIRVKNWEGRKMITHKLLIDVLLNVIPDTITRLSEARRFISMGMVKVNGKIVNDEKTILGHGDILEIGKKFKLTL
jgi:hypothetical protein